MTCEEIESRMAECWALTLSSGQGDHEAESEVEEHLAGCESCRTEAQRLGLLWRDLARLPVIEPGSGVRQRFYETLAAYREGAASGAVRPFPIPALAATPPGWKHLVWQIAAGVVLLLGGLGAGYSIRSTQTTNAEVTQLRGEVGNMRQLVALSLLQQQSASERLRGVSWAYRVEPSDTEVLGALLTAVNHDPNVNVRLAAVDALHPFAASPVTRDAVIQALGKQTAPIVQVALIDLLVDLKETEAAPELEKVASDSATDIGVRQRAQWALEKLQ
ncbi:MAG TPA: HEAT repeat domain-containing protein [Bryobacteraceae bacterium]|jgi:anti-sigma factor RsiW